MLITILKQTELKIKNIKLNAYAKAFIGGTVLVLLSFVVGDQFFWIRT